MDNLYNDWETAMHDLAVMHISYLNEDYDRRVLENGQLPRLRKRAVIRAWTVFPMRKGIWATACF